MDRLELADKIRTLEGITYEEKAELIQLLKEKRYGLVWYDKKETAEEELYTMLPVFKENKDRAIINETGMKHFPNHLLIAGENLHALTALYYLYANAIQVIYIDPPYNTGNKDFLYNDCFVDTEKPFRHSMWLSFMCKRLKVAKMLLSDDGFICISIDDNEQAALKILCDEIFGSSNYINTISIKAKSSSGASGGGEDKKLKKNIEYLLVYAKRREDCNFVFPLKKVPLIDLIDEKREEGKNWMYTNIMYKEGTKIYFGSTTAGNGEEIKLYKVLDFEIKSISDIMKMEKLTEEDVYNKYIDKIFTTENAQTSIRQRVKDAVGNNDDFFIAEYKPVSGRNKGKTIEVGFIGYTKRLVSYLKVTCIVEHGRVYKLDKIGTLWDDLSWSSISNEGGIAFPQGKKPISLIKRIISMHPNKEANVLDFFAGSASTGHAVIELNEEDKGKRRSIQVTNNTKNENYICETRAYPRMVNVINGYNKTVNKRIEGYHDNNLRYYEVEELPRERTAKNLRDLMYASTDMICIKEGMYKELKGFGPLSALPSMAVRHFCDNNGGEMLLIYNERFISAMVEAIAETEITTPIKVYVFSPDSNPFSEEFEEVEDKVELCALPAAILNAYREVLPQKEDMSLEPAAEYESTENEVETKAAEEGEEE